MPGTFAVDVAATFTSAVLISVGPKPKFGGAVNQQETSADGTPKWVAEVAVTFTPTVAGMRAQSELITITVTDRQQPALGLNPGTPVFPDGLRVGLNPPELRDEKLRGGKLWYTATGLRSLASSQSKQSAA